jgi:hypothetical protein
VLASESDGCTYRPTVLRYAFSVTHDFDEGANGVTPAESIMEHWASQNPPAHYPSPPDPDTANPQLWTTGPDLTQYEWIQDYLDTPYYSEPELTYAYSAVSHANGKWTMRIFYHLKYDITWCN